MSSGQIKRHDGFNPVQIKNGMIVRLRKDGTIKAVLGKHGRFEYTNSGTAFAFRIKAKSMKMFARMAASKPKADLFFQNI